MKKWSKK